MKPYIWALCLLLAGISWGQEIDRNAAVGEYFRVHNAALADTPFTGNTTRKFSLKLVRTPPAPH